MDYLKRLPKSLQIIGDANRDEIEILDATKSPPNSYRANSQRDHEFGIVYEDRFIMVVRDFVLFPDGKKGGYVRIINKAEVTDSCGTVLVPTIADHVVFIEVYRHAPRQWHWELPRGFQEVDLSKSENAVKECKEELNCTPSKTILIGKGIHANTGLLSGSADVFLVTLPTEQRSEIRVQKSESIRDFRLVSFGDLDDFLVENVTCGFSLSAIAICRLHNYLVK